MTKEQIAAAVAQMQTKRTVVKQGVYKVDGGWKHSKDSNIVWKERCGAEADYRFACDWERCQIVD